MGVHGSDVPQSLIRPRPDYSRPRCSKSAEHASQAPANNQFFDHLAQSDPDVGHHQVQLLTFAQYRRSQQCRAQWGAGVEIGVHEPACRVWPARADVQHRSFRCAATVIWRLSWGESERCAFSAYPHPDLPPERGKGLNSSASVQNFTCGFFCDSGGAVKFSFTLASEYSSDAHQRPGMVRSSVL